ncbi:MAG: hypothetical protein JO053_01505 [Acidobacteria bacterium]|nr:hypothetical protein [Acidobacteriota bacterium]
MYLIINNQTREVIRTSETPFNVDESVQPPEDHVTQLKEVWDDTKPDFDADTEKLVTRFTDDDAAGTRMYSNIVEKLTADEIAARAAFAKRVAAQQSIQATLADMRAGTGTSAQRLARLEKAVAHLFGE